MASPASVAPDLVPMAARPSTVRLPGSGEQRGRAAALALIGALTAWLAFRSGGFFAGATAVAAMALIGALLLRVTLASQPLAGLSAAGLAGLGCLGLFGAWTLISAQWSQAAARALVEFDRVLVYLLAFALFACLPAGRENARWLLRLLALALGTAALAGLATRLSPALGEALAADGGGRLAWPLGYWNALGLAGAMAIIASLHMSSDLREARAVRVLAAAAVPALAVAVYLTLSRGAILAGAIGVVAFLLLARGRGVAATLLAVLPCSCLALLVAYDAGALVDDRSGDAASARQGAEVARAVLSACAGAGLLRIAGLWVDARLASARLWRRWSLARTAAVVAASAAALIAVGIAAGADRALERQLERFVASQSLTTARPQDRLTEASANGRIQHWEVALEAWQREPLVGHGAGTYANIWAQERPVAFAVQDAHSLYVEVLSDLGLVGAILLAGALGVPLIAMVLRRREDRVVWSAALAIVVTWLVHAGMDWDWEMPALTLPVIALLAAATVRRVPRPPGRFAAMGNLRLVSGLAVLLLALTPARVGLSDRQMSVALTAFERGDCRSAITSSLAALETLSSRPQPLELLGYCDVRTGRADLAVRMLEGAVRRDPDNWEMHYGLAIVRGAARRDPRPQLRRARELNPLSPIVADARRRLRSDSPRVWRREALRSKLVLPE